MSIYTTPTRASWNANPRRLLENDRTVKICIQDKFDANSTLKCLYAPESLLASAGDNLKTWLQMAPVYGNCPVVVHIPNGDYEAWQVFIFWLLNRSVPDDVRSNEVLLVRAWALGEYLVSYDFMADVMLRLLRYYERASASVDAIRYAFCWTRMSSDLSNLRIVVAEETVKTGMFSEEGAIEKAGLGKCSLYHHGCGLEDLPRALQRVEKQLESKPYLMFDRFKNGEIGEEATWMRRMEGQKWREMQFLVRERTRSMMNST